jgi:8-oxo-dGTP pyrophosphatase MutT (NUDIX family)
MEDVIENVVVKETSESVDTRVWNGVSFICFNSEKDKVLILKRADDDDSEPGMWCLPGGGVENEESFEDCLFREVQEETHCEVAEYDYFKSIVVGTRLRVVYFFGSVVDELGVKVNYEHSESLWIKFSDIKNYDFAFNQDKIINEFLEAVGEILD